MSRDVESTSAVRPASTSARTAEGEGYSERDRGAARMASRASLLREVQRRSESAAPAGDPADVQAHAADGVAAASAPLPHAGAIQRAFGRHDITGVRAQVGRDQASRARAQRAATCARRRGLRQQRARRDRRLVGGRRHRARAVARPRAGRRRQAREDARAAATRPRDGAHAARRLQPAAAVRQPPAIHQLAGAKQKLGIKDPKSAEALPVREILERYATAAGVSHLAESSEAALLRVSSFRPRSTRRP